MNYRLIGFVLGEIALIMGTLLCVPLFMALGFHESDTILGFGVAIGICLFLGIIGIIIRPPKHKRDLRPSSGFATCGLFWIFLAIIGAIPFCVSGYIPNFMDALFETTSGFTTTGATILTDVEALPKSLLFWRALTQWLGGMGVLVFVIAILPRNDKMSTALAKAEIPGPQFGKLVSKLRFTTRILYAIYIAMTLILVMLLCICKMPVFDSFCHAFATASTGGFSVKNASIAAYNSVSIDVIITIFMVLFSVNFNIYYFIIIGHVLKAIKNEELICMLLIYICAVAAVTINLCTSKVYDNVADALRYGSFNVASVFSTTGYGTADFVQWPALSQVILLVVMCIGGSAGSTAGGLKVSRLIVLSKSSFISLKRTLSPRSVYSLKFDGKPMDDATISNIRSFLMMYVIILVVSTVLISIEKHNFPGNYSMLETNFSAVIACFNNVGPGIGAVGPTGNYASYSIFAKLVLTIDMLLGRLEILPILLLLHPKSWKKL